MQIGCTSRNIAEEKVSCGVDISEVYLKHVKTVQCQGDTSSLGDIVSRCRSVATPCLDSRQRQFRHF